MKKLFLFLYTPSKFVIVTSLNTKHIDLFIAEYLRAAIASKVTKPLHHYEHEDKIHHEYCSP